MTYRAKKLCRTLAVFLLSVLVLSLLVFVIARLAPGDPLVSYYGERAEKMKPAERAQAEARLGLDQPIAQQYLIWLKGALRGEFGIAAVDSQGALQAVRHAFQSCRQGCGPHQRHPSGAVRAGTDAAAGRPV